MMGIVFDYLYFICYQLLIMSMLADQTSANVVVNRTNSRVSSLEEIGREPAETQQQALDCIQPEQVRRFQQEQRGRTIECG